MWSDLTDVDDIVLVSVWQVELWVVDGQAEKLSLVVRTRDDRVLDLGQTLVKSPEQMENCSPEQRTGPVHVEIVNREFEEHFVFFGKQTDIEVCAFLNFTHKLILFYFFHNIVFFCLELVLMKKHDDRDGTGILMSKLFTHLTLRIRCIAELLMSI